MFFIIADMYLHILFCGLTHIRLLFKANTVGNCHVSLLDASAISSDQYQCQCCFSGLRIHIRYFFFSDKSFRSEILKVDDSSASLPRSRF